MRNDYERNYFWIRTDETGLKHYYFKINGEYHEVERKVFNICHNSYMKQNRDADRDDEAGLISLDGDKYFENPLMDTLSVDDDVIDSIDISERVKEVMHEINRLNNKDRELITNLLIKEKTERELAKQLDVSQVAIHKRKIKIIEKIKKSLEK